MDWLSGNFMWAEFTAAFASIMLINLALSGDNALLIALASRNLPKKQKKWAMFLGGFGAVALRVVLTVIAVILLRIPYLQFVGGVLILWIAVKLLKEEKDGEDTKSGSSLWEAVKIIIVADLLMSTDNVLAIAGVSTAPGVKEYQVPLLIIGLATSIPIIILGARLVIMLMKKYPVIIYIGAGVLGWTGGEMLISDVRILHILVNVIPEGLMGILDKFVPLFFTLMVIFLGYLLKKRTKEKEVVPKGRGV